MINPTEVNSLIRLLDDPDREIFEHVHEKLLSYGSEAIEYLESAWEQAFDPIQQERIANLVHEIQFGIVKNDLKLMAPGRGVRPAAGHPDHQPIPIPRP